MDCAHINPGWAETASEKFSVADLGFEGWMSPRAWLWADDGVHHVPGSIGTTNIRRRVFDRGTPAGVNTTLTALVSPAVSSGTAAISSSRHSVIFMQMRKAHISALELFQTEHTRDRTRRHAAFRSHPVNLVLDRVCGFVVEEKILRMTSKITLRASSQFYEIGKTNKVVSLRNKYFSRSAEICLLY